MNDDIKKIQSSAHPSPGPCPIIDGVPICPPPTEIDIIKVKKVFQECRHTQVEEVRFDFETYDYDNDHEDNYDEYIIKYSHIEVLEEGCTILTKGLVKFQAKLAITLTLDGSAETREVEINKNFRLSRAGEQGLVPQCHIFPKYLSYHVTDEDAAYNVVAGIACIGVLILIKLEAEVQLLVPTYGYPPLPPNCEQVIGECPDDFQPDWPPYPAQNRQGNNNSGECNSCG
ncbi:MAG: hypothetical protein KGZ96_13330 [Clostridia bacterium]|nr:hypothetical protein [Clostridia bacterium]